MSERKCYTCGGERGNWYYIGDVRRWNRCRSCAGSGWVFGERAEHHDMLERAETRRNPEYITPKCDSCEILVINNIATHEGGCPKSWIDPVTNKPHAVECGWCLTSFVPDYKGQKYCDESCAASDRKRNPIKGHPEYNRKNERRVYLIVKDVDGIITSEEKVELAELEQWTTEYQNKYIDKRFPGMRSQEAARLRELEKQLGIDPPGANMYRRNPDEDYSPGNFRQPTLEKCQEYLDWWADQGVTRLSDLNTFDMTPEERALDKIRWSEAKYYWDRYQKQLGKSETDSYVYRKPLLSVPREDAEDYGDFEVVSVKAAQNYLYNFFTRQAERTEAELPLQDVELYPWKPRYDECVSILGQDEVDRIEQNIFDRAELVLYRRNPGACATCGLTNCPCGCYGDPSLCTCRRRRNPGYYDSMADRALSYAYSKPRRRNAYGRPAMPW